MTHDGVFATIEPDECRQLLRTQRVGRVAWSSSDGLVILPVNYVLNGDEIAFAVAPETLLGELADGYDVAFQVDFSDAEAANGWSVLARGTTHEVTTQLQRRPDPWVPGNRSVIVAFAPTLLSGRAVLGTDERNS